MNKKLIIPLSFSLVLCGCSAMLPYRDSFKCEKGKDGGVCNSVVEVYELSDDMDMLRIKASSPKDRENAKENKKNKIPTSFIKSSNDEKGLREIANSMSIKQIQDGKPVIFNINGHSLVGYSYEVPNNQQVLDYLIKDNNAYIKRLRDESDENLINKTLDSKSSNSNLYGENHYAGVNDKDSVLRDLLADDDSFNNFTKQSKTQHNNIESIVNPSYSTNQNAVDNHSNNSLKALENGECQSGDNTIVPINADVKICVYSANIRQKPSCNAKVLRVAKSGEILYGLYSQGGWVKLSDGTFVHRSIIKIKNKEY